MKLFNAFQSGLGRRPKQSGGTHPTPDYRRLVEASGDIIVQLDRNLVTNYISPAIQDILGYRPDELIGNMPRDMVHPDDAERFAAAYATVLAGVSKGSVSGRIRHRDGHWVWLDYSLSPLRDPVTGGIDGVLAAARTMEDREEAQRAVAEREAMLQTLFATTPDCVFINKVDGGGTYRIETYNAAAEKIMGVPAEQIAGKSMEEVLPPDVAARANQEFDEALASSQPIMRMSFLNRPEGMIHWEVTQMAVRDDAGTPIRVISYNRDVTQKIRQQQALRDSEERFRNAIEKAAIGIALVTEEGQWVEVNDAFLAIVGYTEEELRRLTPSDITYPSDRNLEDENITALLRGDKKSYSLEKRYLRKDGTSFWVRLSTSLVRDERGKPAYFVGQIEDIDARRRAEDQLAESRAKLEETNRLLLMAEEIAKFGHWRLDAATRAVQWSDEVYRIHGLPIGTEMDRDRGIALYAPEDREHVTQCIERTLKFGEPYKFELRLIGADGLSREVAAIGQPERSEDGTVTGIFGVFQDITERKFTERERTELLDRITLAAKAAEVGIWEWYVPADSVVWDDKMFELYGLDRQTAKHPGRISRAMTHPEDLKEAEAAMRRAVRTGEPFDVEFRITRPDGEPRRLRTQCMVMLDKDNRLNRLIGTSTDVTEFRKLNDELQAEKSRLLEMVEKYTVAKDLAEEASRAKSDFLTMMSHELRTPMNGILGFGQLLETKRFGPLNSNQEEFVRSILGSGRHLLALINDVLELSKVETGRLTVSLERVDLDALTKAAIANLADSAEIYGVRLVHRNREPPPEVRADRTRLAQVLMNLGSNAIKYNRPGGLATFSYETLDEGSIRLVVTDTGIGIPEARHAEMFQPFNRLGAEKLAIEGTGIGLALTRQLVELMEGKIGFSSNAGEGSRFWIDIPLWAEDTQPRPRPVVPVEATLGNAPSFCALYIEDDPSNLTLMRHLLGSLGNARLIEATTGADGMSLAVANRPDLILLDINLPDANGFGLLQKMKRIPELAETPVIALSASALPRDINRGEEAGFFRYLTKPLDINIFLEAAEAALTEARAIRPEA